MNRLFLSFIAGFSLSVLTGCGPSAEEKAAEERRNLGETILSEINRAGADKDHQRVIELCDSLDRACSDQTALREKALVAWTDARYYVLLDSAAFLDGQLDSLTYEMSTLMPDFVQMEISSGLDNYRIIKSLTNGTPL
ncbi:MAG: hypothetical protein K2K84_00855, partial [Muribaculaceae bacterium]|nr:hypothetical protein [Muribaculaceae bacterium]